MTKFFAVAITICASVCVAACDDRKAGSGAATKPDAPWMHSMHAVLQGHPEALLYLPENLEEARDVPQPSPCRINKDRSIDLQPASNQCYIYLSAQTQVRWIVVLTNDRVVQISQQPRGMPFNLPWVEFADPTGRCGGQGICASGGAEKLASDRKFALQPKPTPRNAGEAYDQARSACAHLPTFSDTADCVNRLGFRPSD